VDCFTEDACAALYPFPGKTPTLHIWSQGDGLRDMACSFGEYLALLVHARGFWCWQAALTEQGQDREETEAFRSAMPLLFPDFEEELFFP
jgi:hypothetical protein